jgi:hypothetical protein
MPDVTQTPATNFETPRGRSPNRRAVTPTASPEDPYGEIGTSGLRQVGGFVLEEWLTQLSGRRAAWVYREMMDNNPVIGAILFAIEWMGRQMTWHVEPGAQEADAEFIEQCMGDMEHSWGDFITEALSMLPYGYAFHETVYKLRNGRQKNAPVADDGGATSEDTAWPADSKFNDGKIGWRCLPGRAQETLLRWQFDGYSRVSAFVQIDWHGGYHVVPTSKGLLFRSRPRRSNPEGYSILRPAYTSYFNLKNIQQLEAIGIERDLAGIPKLTPPEGVDLFAPGNSNLLAKAQKMVSSVRRDEFEGLVMPTAGWLFELVSTGGARQIDTDAIIRRYEQRIAASMLADFVLLGQDAVGSFALASVKGDLFGLALDGIMDLITEVLNKQAVLPLLELNGMNTDDPPTIAHSSATQMDLAKVGQFLFDMAGAGAEIPWNRGLLETLFDEAGLPANFDEEKLEPIPKVVDPDAPEEPVGPPKLTPGQDPFAREPHYEPAAMAATVPVDPKTGKPMAAKPAAVEPVKKAEAEQVPGGTVYHLHGVFHQRQAALASQLEREVSAAFNELGEQAAQAYLTMVRKADAPKQTKNGQPHLQSLVAAIMKTISPRNWFRKRMQPLFTNHANRVLADTTRVVSSEIGLQAGPLDQGASKRVESVAGSTGLGLRDIEPQVRQSILQAIKAGQQAGEHPMAIANRIRTQVPAGRFVNAGPAYRAKLIARTETANMQRVATLETYRSMPNVHSIEVSDGQLADSDEDCIARDGLVVPIEDADSIQPLHPNCTLSLSPIVSAGQPRLSLPEPELITV